MHTSVIGVFCVVDSQAANQACNGMLVDVELAEHK